MLYKMTGSLLTLLLFGMYLNISQVSALQCYECAGVQGDNSNCDQPKGGKLVECPLNLKKCLIRRTSVAQGIVTYLKSCVAGQDNENKCLSNSNYGMLNTICFCDNKDGCNAGKGIHTRILSLILVPFTLYMLTRLL